MVKHATRLTLSEKWAWSSLAQEAELTKQLTFDKVEATADDVFVILRTARERAADLGMDAKDCISLTLMSFFSPWVDLSLAV
jgi:hypothetical protein